MLPVHWSLNPPAETSRKAGAYALAIAVQLSSFRLVVSELVRLTAGIWCAPPPPAPSPTTCKVSPVALKKVQPVGKPDALQRPLVVEAIVGIQPRQEQHVQDNTCNTHTHAHTPWQTADPSEKHFLGVAFEGSPHSTSCHEERILLELRCKHAHIHGHTSEGPLYQGTCRILIIDP